VKNVFLKNKKVIIHIKRIQFLFLAKQKKPVPIGQRLFLGKNKCKSEAYI
jgi:hypothetical protein